jgi:aminoglycoside phosphotransferase (APT) family kinase protein
VTDAADIVETLKASGFLPRDAAPTLQSLTGGVSSDVFRLDTARGPVCVKRALAKLRVAADWRAPVERSHYEVEWLKTARDPATHSVWKADLAEGRVDVGFAGRVGALLAAVHAGAAGSDEIAARFQTTPLFEDLRLKPFLRHCAEAHPDLAPRLVALADRTAAARITLVHGDVSPKNILHGPQGPVLLDAECAWYGDPAFDLAFCSAHLLLKTVWKPPHAMAYLAAFAALQRSYLAGVTWEDAGALEARAAELTAAVLLARVDGKSPADYLRTDEDRSFVRDTARRFVASTPPTMSGLAAAWRDALGAR